MTATRSAVSPAIDAATATRIVCAWIGCRSASGFVRTCTLAVCTRPAASPAPDAEPSAASYSTTASSMPGIEQMACLSSSCRATRSVSSSAVRLWKGLVSFNARCWLVPSFCGRASASTRARM